MKTLLALLLGAIVMAIASMSPAAAKESPPLRCLVLDNLKKDIVIDVCKCVAKVSVTPDTRKLLRPNPLRVVAMCPAVINGGAGLVSDVPDDEYPPSHHGHGFSFSKASSSSGVVSFGIVIYGTPVAGTLQGQRNKSLALGQGRAGAEAGTAGTAGASIVNSSSTTIQPYSAPGYAPIGGQQGGSSQTVSTAGDGSTSGGSCAGSSCN